MNTYFLNMPAWVWLGFLLVGVPWLYLFRVVTGRTCNSHYRYLEMGVAIIWLISIAFGSLVFSHISKDWSPDELAGLLCKLWMFSMIFFSIVLSRDFGPEKPVKTVAGSLLITIVGLSWIGYFLHSHSVEHLNTLAAYQELKDGQRTVIVLPSRFEPVLGKANEIVGWKIIQTTHPELDLCLVSGKLGFDLHSAYVSEKNQMVRIKFDEALTNPIVVSDATVEPITWR